jgi:hypothetical protein
LHSI